MKVAFATTDGTKVDEHFGRAGMFAVYEVKEDGFSFIEMRKFAEGRDTEVERTRGMREIHDDLVQKKVDSLGDCKIIYLTEIGGPSASRLVKKGIMPVKVKDEVSIAESLQRLSDAIRKSPPPWLKKAVKET